MGPQLHLLDPEAASGLAGSVASGVLTPEFRSYLDVRSPDTYLDQIDTPTLIQGGTSDTLFSLVNAISVFKRLKQRGVPVEMSWNCEGHSLCPGSTGPVNEHFDAAVINWFDRWLKDDPRIDTGAGFSWLADNESKYRSAASFPPRVTRHLRGQGSGTLPLTPAAPASSLGFLFIGAQPARGAVEVPISPPKEPQK